MNKKQNRKRQMRKKQKWIKRRLDGFAFRDPLREQAISNVREAQERELENFRESIDQDVLECQEFKRLVKEDADRRFSGKVRKRMHGKTERGKGRLALKKGMTAMD